MPARLPLSEAHQQLLAKGVSAIACTRNAALRPQLMRAVGTAWDAARQQATVYLRRSQSAALLDDLAAGSPLAVVYSEPSSHRTLQLKAGQTHVRPAGPQDAALLTAYLGSMQYEVGLVGYGPDFVAAMLHAPLHDVVAVQFQPDAAFDQTPGPRAGQAVDGRP